MGALAAIGAHGLYPANCRRDLMRLLRVDQYSLPQPYIISVLMWDTLRRVIDVDYPMILPHELVGAIWLIIRMEFHRIFGALQVQL